MKPLWVYRGDGWSKLGIQMVDERHLVAQSWPVAIHFGPLGGAKGHKRAQKEPWDQVKGCKEAPGRHQGGTKEAPRNDLHIDMGPRALKKEN